MDRRWNLGMRIDAAPRSGSINLIDYRLLLARLYDFHVRLEQPAADANRQERTSSKEPLRLLLPVRGVMASPTQPDHQRGFESFEQIPDAIIVVDRQGTIRYANDHAARLFGHAPATLLPHPI